MKKSLLALLTVFVLMFTMAIPAAGADGIRDRIQGLKEKIRTAIDGRKEEGEKNYTVENLVKKLISYVEEKCEENGIEPSEALDQVMGLITNDEGKIDLSAVVSLLGRLTGSSSEDGNFILEIDKRDLIIEEYVLDKYQDAVGEGDVALFSMTSILNEEYDTKYTICRYILTVYTPEGKDLKEKSVTEAIEYMEFDVDEDLNFIVTETIPVEEGENKDAAIDALCEKMGALRETYDAYCNDMESEWTLTFYMSEMLEKNPEYERIEYRGEMKTAEEISEINMEIMDAIFEVKFAEEPEETVESAEADETEEAAE